VTMIQADCFGDGDEARLARWISKGWVDAELFLCFTAGGVCWMFVGLDVTSGRQPELRVDVVDQQAASIAWIDQDDVRHQMWSGSRGLGSPEHIIGAFEPAKGPRSVFDSSSSSGAISSTS
jgi:hypothetical protein